MMSLYNHNGALVWNTYQCYLKDVERSLHQDLSLCAHLGVAFGAKVVRGAYLERERCMALEGGYLDPVHDTWELTCDSYTRVMDSLLELASRHGDRCCVIVATHNEESLRQAVRRMKQLGIPPDATAVCFGQLLGMCDHVSLTLGNQHQQQHHQQHHHQQQ
uniref:Proline dehydrogenase n=1 Tax=Petromyzon marinus TaxID=7757 RepID=A0AAJ7SKI9_PETMA